MTATGRGADDATRALVSTFSTLVPGNQTAVRLTTTGNQALAEGGTYGIGGAPLELRQNGDWSVPWPQWLAVIDTNAMTNRGTVITGGTQPGGISYSSHPPAAAPAGVTTLDVPKPSPQPNQSSQQPDLHSGHH